MDVLGTRKRPSTSLFIPNLPFELQGLGHLQCYCFFLKIEYAKLAPPIYVLTILNNVAYMVLGALELA